MSDDTNQLFYLYYNNETNHIGNITLSGFDTTSPGTQPLPESTWKLINIINYKNPFVEGYKGYNEACKGYTEGCKGCKWYTEVCKGYTEVCKGCTGTQKGAKGTLKATLELIWYTGVTRPFFFYTKELCMHNRKLHAIMLISSYTCSYLFHTAQFSLWARWHILHVYCH